MFRVAFLTFIMGVMAVLAQGCNDTDFTSMSGGFSLLEDPNTPTVCDPFGGGVGPSEENGIEAMLTYIPAGAPAIARGLSTAAFAPSSFDVIVSPARLVLGQLNVPTRPFTDGFSVRNSSDRLQTMTGEDLVEYFSLRAQSNLRLSAGDPEGNYDLALLSDDGSILDLSPSGAESDLQPWIGNDGTHANQLGCAPRTLSMRRGALYPIRMNYYQGPRVRIALMLLWRLRTSSSVAEPECGRERDDFYFFTPIGNQSSVPTSNYNAMLARGWRPVPAANFVLPGNRKNPCL